MWHIYVPNVHDGVKEGHKLSWLSLSCQSAERWYQGVNHSLNVLRMVVRGTGANRWESLVNGNYSCTVLGGILMEPHLKSIVDDVE